MLFKLLHFAPIVIATSGVVALVSFRIEDPRLKKILRGIAFVLFFASAASVASEAIRLLEQGANTQRVIAEQQRLAREELAKAAEAAARAKAAEALAKEAALRAEEMERNARLQKEEAELAARVRLEEIEREAKRRADENQRLEEVRRREHAAELKSAQDEQVRRAHERRRQIQEAELVFKRRQCEVCCRAVVSGGSVSECVAMCVNPRGVFAYSSGWAPCIKR
ncbi:MAG: hypothetical protein R3D27_13960 [Hyphomicrobiaceae bacterium]